MKNIKTMSESNLETALRSELNQHLLVEARATLETGASLQLTLPISDSDEAVGTALATAITRRYGDQGLPEGTVSITFHGHAGQRFGAENTAGIELTLIGEAGDFVGQGMCGGQIIIRPSLKTQLGVSRAMMAGNGVLEEAAAGNLFVAGQVGENFARRNNGATAVVEGTGDKGCAEMTGGVVVVLGQIGRHFGVDMQGGMAFVLDADLSQRPFVDTASSARVTDKADVEVLKHLVSRHVRLTGSIHGQEILDDWSNRLARFWKVLPVAVAATVA